MFTRKRAAPAQISTSMVQVVGGRDRKESLLGLQSCSKPFSSEQMILFHAFNGYDLFKQLRDRENVQI